MWMKGTEWLDTVVAMRPYWLVRTLAGISMDIGISLLVINLMKTALSSSKNDPPTAKFAGTGEVA